MNPSGKDAKNGAKSHVTAGERSKNPLAHIAEIVSILRREAAKYEQPIVGTFVGTENAEYKILISTILSLRTKDKTTGEASLRLFALADTPQKMLTLPPARIEKAIYPVGFYRVKAKNILEISRQLLDRFDGRVPDDIDILLTLPGVGRKTANLVVTLAYRKPGICVDIHVHRISNRLGLVKTENPLETEMRLRDVLPEKFWISINDLFVMHGQNICVPVSPFCSRCPIFQHCDRKGVQKSR